MGTLIFTCPITNLNVQHWLDQDNDTSDDEFEGIACPACTRLHFINRKTGKLFGESSA